jgi:hypothetical protein
MVKNYENEKVLTDDSELLREAEQLEEAPDDDEEPSERPVPAAGGSHDHEIAQNLFDTIKKYIIVADDELHLLANLSSTLTAQRPVPSLLI